MSNVITLETMQQSILTTRIKSISALIEHKWSEKAKQMMRDKHQGVKVKNRDVRDPEQEFRMLLTFVRMDALVSQRVDLKGV